jgi:hypothetical protein
MAGEHPEDAMGMFDTVRCEHPLPDPAHQELEFQTKDLDCYLEDYTITRDGRLVRHERESPGASAAFRDVEWPVHGDLRMYASLGEEGGASEWVEYVVRFAHGRVERIRRAPRRHASAEALEADVPDEARLLVRRLRLRAPVLDPAIAPSLGGRPLDEAEYMAHVPEKIELLDGHVPGEEPLLLLLLASVGLRRAAVLVGREAWECALREGGR